MGFTTEAPLETASFPSINLLKCIKTFTIQIWGFFTIKLGGVFIT